MSPATSTNLKIVLIVVGTLGLYTLVASSIPQVRSEVPEELSFTGEISAEELVAAGEDLYDGAGGCTACHGTGTRAPNLLTSGGGEGPIGERCGQRAAGMECKAYLYEAMVEPGAYLVEGFGNIMPDQRRTLSEAQIWAIIAFLQAQGGEVTVTGEDIQSTQGESGGPVAPAAAPAGGGAAAGGAQSGGTASLEPMTILQNNMCLNCHVLGDQGTQLGPSLDGIGARMTENELRTAILDPNADASEGFEAMVGIMPATFGNTLTAAQLEALVDFLADRE